MAQINWANIYVGCCGRCKGLSKGAQADEYSGGDGGEFCEFKLLNFIQ